MRRRAFLGTPIGTASHRAQPKTTLKLTPMADAAEELFEDWRQLAPRLCAWCDAWLRGKGGKVFEVRFGPGYVMVSIPTPKEGGPAGSMDELPLLMVNPVGDAEHWLQEAPAAFETLRRHLEESGRAVLDGVASAAVMQSLQSGSIGPFAVDTAAGATGTDAGNSELVLLKGDRVSSCRGSGYEVARGSRADMLGTAPSGDGGAQSARELLWMTGPGGSRWGPLCRMAIIDNPSQGLRARAGVITIMSETDSWKLLRRYKLVQQVLFRQNFKHHEVTKRLQYLSGPSGCLPC